MPIVQNYDRLPTKHIFPNEELYIKAMELGEIQEGDEIYIEDDGIAIDELYYNKSEMDIKLGDINTKFSDYVTTSTHNGNIEEINTEIEEINVELEELSNNTQLKSNLTTSIESTSTDTQYPSAKAVYDKLAEVDNNLDRKQDKSNLVTNIVSTSTDTQYPSAKAVYNELANKQDALTIESDLISGNDNPVTSGAVKDAIDGVIEIASGKCKTYVFDSYEELTVHLLGDENGENQDTVLLDSLRSGDVLLIRALYEPDFWWEEVKTRAMVRANFESEIIVSGYGVARVLETTKCDLTNYALNTDIPTQLSALETDKNHLLVTQAEKDTWSAKSNFSGNYNDLTNKPTIPTIPSSLPANGGNADTVDGYHIRTGTSGAAGYITFVV